MNNVERNKELMKTLDDAWNSQDWETFRKRHADNTAVFWPGKPESTRGRNAHEEESIEFFKTLMIHTKYCSDRMIGPARWRNSPAR